MMADMGGHGSPLALSDVWCTPKSAIFMSLALALAKWGLSDDQLRELIRLAHDGGHGWAWFTLGALGCVVYTQERHLHVACHLLELGHESPVVLLGDSFMVHVHEDVQDHELGVVTVDLEERFAVDHHVFDRGLRVEVELHLLPSLESFRRPLRFIVQDRLGRNTLAAGKQREHSVDDGE